MTDNFEVQENLGHDPQLKIVKHTNWYNATHSIMIQFEKS